MRKRRQSQRGITRLAQGQECQIRIPGVCCFEPEKTVPCHFRMSGLSGGSYIPDELFVAWGCSPCHAYVDTHKDAETQLAFAHGVFRTQALLLSRELICIGVGA